MVRARLSQLVREEVFWVLIGGFGMATARFLIRTKGDSPLVETSDNFGHVLKISEIPVFLALVYTCLRAEVRP